MPGINSKALELCKQVASDVLSLKVGQEVTMDFKDEPVTIRRVR